MPGVAECQEGKEEKPELICFPPNVVASVPVTPKEAGLLG